MKRKTIIKSSFEQNGFNSARNIIKTYRKDKLLEWGINISCDLEGYIENYPLAPSLMHEAENGDDVENIIIRNKQRNTSFTEFLSQYEGIELYTIGNLARHIARNTTLKSSQFENNEQCADYIAQNAPKNATILLKASRSMKFEQIIEKLKELYHDND